MKGPDPKGLSFGYVPYSSTLEHPGDKRRFPFWARSRGVRFEVARPGARYDVIVLSERADLTKWARTPRTGHARLVYDLIDSYLAVPPGDPKDLARGVGKFLLRQQSAPTWGYRRAVEAMCRRADGVVCTTIEQASAIAAYNKNVHLVLDHHPMSFARKVDYARGAGLRLVWEGLPHTIPGFDHVATALRRLAVDVHVHVDLVTDATYARAAGRWLTANTLDLARRHLPVSFSLLPWSEQALVAALPGADLAVIPLDPHDAFASGKPENKLLLLWRAGMPVVTTQTPAYDRAMGQAGMSLTCRDADEWEATLRRLLDDEAERRRAGELGLAFVDEHHGPDARLQAWDRVIESVVGP